MEKVSEQRVDLKKERGAECDNPKMNKLIVDHFNQIDLNSTIKVSKEIDIEHKINITKMAGLITHRAY